MYIQDGQPEPRPHGDPSAPLPPKKSPIRTLDQKSLEGFYEPFWVANDSTHEARAVISISYRICPRHMVSQSHMWFGNGSNLNGAQSMVPLRESDVNFFVFVREAATWGVCLYHACI